MPYQALFRCHRGNNSIRYVGVGVQKIKQYATGKHNATKPMMIRAAKRRWTDDFEEDEADARWITAYGMDQHIQPGAPAR